MNELLKFTPILKSVMWGGKRLAAYKGFAISDTPIGESWELSPIEGMESVVAEGSFKGKKLSELLTEFSVDILGRRLSAIHGNRFPLLIKFIDSADNLSVQVHPDDSIALRRHACSGKSEMWYSIAPEKDSYLFAGFSQCVNRDQFRRLIRDNKVTDVLQKYFTRPGDVLFIPAGRIHSMGAGNLLLEIQQASDVTYRVYDYDRRDASGKKRELHIEESIEALDFKDCKGSDISNVQAIAGQSNRLATCRYFTADITGIDGRTEFDLSSRDSFTALTAVSGNMNIECPHGKMSLHQGETVLVPACLTSIIIEGRGSVISVYIE